MKILIIDDSKTMRRIVTNVVKQLLPSAEITEAEDGAEAIKFLAKEKFDVMLCDINMPNKNGYEVLEFCNSMNIKDMFKAMITTEGGKPEVIKALKLGANQYIIKPFNAETLKEKLKTIIKD